MKPGVDGEVFIAKAAGENVTEEERRSKGRTLFHLSTLEATFIKILQPELCRQKEFVYTLKLRH